MTTNNKPIIGWILCICLMVLVMVTIGGITRLTDSGLSIVEWRPIVGSLPPLNYEQWMKAFNQYNDILYNSDSDVEIKSGDIPQF